MNSFWTLFPWVLLLAGLAAGFALGQRRAAHQLQARLDHTTARLRRISQAVESTSDAIGIGDMEGHSLYHNRAHLELFGYTVDELNAVPEAGVLFADKTLAPEILASVKSGRSWSGETDVLTRQGKRVPAFVRADIIRDEAGRPVGIYGVFANITEQRRRAQEQERTGRLESLGLMAGGIAHDFGNLMTAMLARLYFLREIERLPEEATEHLRELEQVMHRATALTQQLRDFARGGTPQKKIIPLPPLVRDSARLALTGTGTRVELDDHLPGDLQTVEADPTQLGQVIHNIVLNAVQAMGGKGRVRLHARNLAAGTELSRNPTAEWVCVSISDTGPGIAAEVLPKIFDPFFTTKERGTGLGLATSYTIVEKHGGYLRVESAAGTGTTFHVFLPVVLNPRPLPA